VTPVVVKVGGSLYDLPDLGPRLRAWLSTLPEKEVVLVPGGGALADGVRDLDRQHRLGEEASHWLALRALSVQAHFLAALLPNAVVVDTLAGCRAVWQADKVAVLDGHAFARDDEASERRLPHRWSATSDSLAARVAEVAGAARLVLLKSVNAPPGVNWSEAGRRGLVDDCFAGIVRRARLEVSVVNLRAWGR
jgi:aspartokinase-like uncharacterized kinase